MIGKIRRTRLIARGSERLSQRAPGVSLFVVATEDTYAAKQYLEALQEWGLVNRSRVEIITLPTTDGRSSLHALLERLKDYGEALDIRLDDDEFWAVFDVDHHDAKELSNATQLAKSRRHRLAGSNPCFELWLLLHLTDSIEGIPSASDDRHAARACEKRLHEMLQAGDTRARGYNKNSIGVERFAIRELVEMACANARTLAAAAEEPWPSSVGTYVFALIESLPRPLTSSVLTS